MRTMTLRSTRSESRHSVDWSWMAILAALTVFWIAGFVLVADGLIG